MGLSLQKLRSGERGWILMAQAAALFSHEKRQYAFGELDDDGKTRLAQFAARIGRHRTSAPPKDVSKLDGVRDYRLADSCIDQPGSKSNRLARFTRSSAAIATTSSASPTPARAWKSFPEQR
jgi:hypothetical protein